ncbi:MAG: hypothetical protein CSA62_00260 [Planctomycetota bacterium]|nr:MAG: hypothetical protein CSA62_00260 [Planctomycetota bacterium]
MNLHWERPIALFALLVVPWLLWLLRRSQSPLSPRRRRFLTLVQALTLTSLALALAGPWLSGGLPATARFVLLPSMSPSPEAVQQAGAWREATPHSDPFEVLYVGSRSYSEKEAESLGREILDRPPALAHALRSICARLPKGAPAELLYQGPARVAGPDPLVEWPRLSAHSVRFHFRPTPIQEQPVELLALEHPSQVEEGAAIPFSIEFRSAKDAELGLRLSSKADLLLAKQIRVQAGTQRRDFALPPLPAGTHELQLELSLSGAAKLRERSALLVSGRTRVAHLCPSNESLAVLSQALQVHGIDLQPLGEDPRQLDEVDVVLVDDMPASAWSRSMQEEVARRVAEGGLGLLLTGAHGNLGPGGYADSPLMPVLPARMPQREERRDPSVSLVLIVDTSGSMGSRLELAKEVARLALRRLEAQDKVGIVEFHGAKRWAAPLQPAGNVIEITRALNRLQVGGGTIIYSALEEAYYGLLDARTRFKHVLVLTDGGVESGPFEALLRRMSASGITLSTVLVGPQTQGPFLMNLAQWGRGRFYACPSRFQLPELRFKEPQSTPLPALRETPVALKPTQPSEVLAGLEGGEALRAGGLVEAQPRPGARSLLEGDGGQSVLLGWDHGLGRVFVFATELSGPLARELGASPRFAPWLSELLRNAAAGHAGHRSPRLEVSREYAGAKLLLIIPPDSTLTPARLKVQYADKHWELPLMAEGPGRFTATVPWAGQELHRFSAAGAKALALPPLVLPSATQDRALSLTKLAELSGGGLEGPLPIEGPKSKGSAAQPLARILAAIALGLFLCSLLIRRLPFGSAASMLFAFLILPAAAQAKAPVQSAPQAAPQNRAPPTDAAERAKAIQAQLAATGELDSLRKRWGKISPRLAIELARAEGRLERCCDLLATLPDPKLADRELRIRILSALGREKAARAELDSLLEHEELPAARRFSWLVHRAELSLPGTRAAAWRAAAAAAPGAETRARVALLAGLHTDLKSAVALSRPNEASNPLLAFMQQALWLERLGKAQEADRRWASAYELAEKKRDKRFILVRRQALARRAGTREAFARSLTQQKQVDPFQREALFSVLRGLGRSAEASRLASHFAELEEDALEQEKLKAQALLFAVEADDRERALKLGRARLAENPERKDTRRALARILAEQRQHQEATELIVEAMKKAPRRKLLLAWIQEAQELGLGEAFAKGLELLRASAKEADKLQALLFELQWLRNRGRSREATQLLSNNKSAFHSAPARLRIAESLESSGRLQEAIGAYRELWKETRAEDVGFRLAWLLSTRSSPEERQEAQQIFESLWYEASSNARRVQVEERVLEVAARNGSLADLAIRLEEELEDPKTPHRDAKRRALVKIYSRARDSMTAASLLETWAREEPQRELDALRELSRVHLENDEYRLHERCLRRMMKLDPKGELEYRQELAMAALERGRPAEAALQLREMTRSQSPSAVSLEFAAGIMMLAGDFDRALRLYRRAYAQHPDRIETLLLWARAEKKRGTPERALDFLANILLQDIPDDLFLVAIDGLLNLSAPAKRLGFALREIRRRIAEQPHRVYLYRAHQDVLEALERKSERVHSIEDCLLVAGMQRGAWLRELFDEAAASGNRERYLDYGAQLLSLGGELPPGVFLEIGEAHLKAEDLRGAERAFARARFSPDYVQHERRIARLFEEGGYLREAENLRRRILLRDDENPRALLDLARILEMRNQNQEAGTLYRDACLLLAGSSRPQSSNTPRGFQRNRPVSGPSFAAALDGLLRCRPSKEALLPVFAALEQELRKYPPQTGAEAASVFSDFERVAELLDIKAKREKVEELSKSFLHRFSEDPIFTRVLQQRCERLGDLAQATALAGKSKKSEAELLRLSLLADPSSTLLEEQLSGLSSQTQTRLLTHLYLLGQVEHARGLSQQLLAEKKLPRNQHQQLARLFHLPLPPVIDPGKKLAELLARPFPNKDRELATHLRRLLAVAPKAGEARQAMWAQLIVKVKEKGGVQSRMALLPILVKASASPARKDLIRACLADVRREYDLRRAAPLLVALPLSEARRSLQEILSRFDEAGRRRAVMLTLSQGQLSDEIGKLLVQQLSPDNLAPSDFNRLSNVAFSQELGRPVLAALHAKMSQSLPEHPLTALLGVKLAENESERRVLLRLACSLLMTSHGLSDHSYQRYLEVLLPMMSRSFAKEILGELGKRRQDQLFASTILWHLGQARQAFDRLADLIESSPDDVFLLHRAQSLGAALGEEKRLRKIYLRHLERSPKLYAYQATQLAELLLKAGAPGRALAALSKVEDKLGYTEPMRLRILLADINPERRQAELRAFARRYMMGVRERKSRITYFSSQGVGERILPKDIEGLGELPLTRRDPDTLASQRREALLLGQVPGGAKLARMLLSVLPASSRIEDLGLFAAARADRSAAEILAEARAIKPDLAAERLMLLGLAEKRGARLTAVEFEQLLRYNCFGTQGAATTQLAQLLHLAHSADSDLAQRAAKILASDRYLWQRYLLRLDQGPRWLAWYVRSYPKLAVDLLPEAEARHRNSFDSTFLAAVLTQAPEQVDSELLAERLSPMYEEGGQQLSQMQLSSSLPLSGLMLLRGRLDSALALLAVPDRFAGTRDGFDGLALQAALPKLALWKDPKLAAKYEEALAAQLESVQCQPPAQRLLAFRLLALLGQRYVEAGRAEDAKRIEELLSENDPGLAISRSWLKWLQAQLSD